MHVTAHLDELSVFERRSDYLTDIHPNVTVVISHVRNLDISKKILATIDGKYNPID